ncbi:MAG: twin-arginine translocase subunit TatC [Acidimicrobiia bacterium]|nr:twin-arginine translocase subunit TatC [Acidimicrobiia bacterium]
MDEVDESRMTLVEHLAELRNRLIKSVIAVVLGGVVCWIVYDLLLDVLLAPYCATIGDADATLAGEGECSLLVTDPLEGFALRLKVAAYGGIALAMPVILWQLWRFITPGLYSHERRYAVPFVGSGLVLFVLGAGLAYWTLPRALAFLQSIGGPNLVEAYSPSPYLNLIIYMMLAFGIGFEFPIVLIFLQIAGVLHWRQLARFRRYAIVGIVVLVAVITPSGDPFSLMVLSVPMYLFYEAAILFGRLRARRRARAETS